jgi:single-stranded-DNA-specific exonuclease
METAWELAHENEQALSDELLSELDPSFRLSPLTLKFLYGRGLRSRAQIDHYLYANLEELQDPYAVPGMREAVEVIRRHIAARNMILIHGDYDVDGVTSSAVLYRVLAKVGARVSVFLPHRMTDGYGLTRVGVARAKATGASLLITADCGITAFEPVREARAAGIDVIVTDHHQLSPHGLPEATAIVHAALAQSGEPFRDLSAVGLAYKLAQALVGEASFDLLDLVALGTVADVAPLVGENRIFVRFGLERLAAGKNVGLRAIASQARLRGRPNASHLAFVFGPRINASGRVDSADHAFRLLVSEDAREAEELARKLEEENKLRRRLEREAVSQAVEKVEREVHFNRDRVIVVWDRRWHPGVIGIVASRLVDRFYRPAVVISVDEKGMGKGSARSVRYFNVFRALSEASGHLVEYGGHEQAAGLKIEERNLEAFREDINRVASSIMEVSCLVKSFDVDLEVPDLEALSPQFLREIELLEPFGAGNPKPVFLTRNLMLKGKPEQAGENRLRFWITDGRVTFEAVWQKAKPVPWHDALRMDVLYTPALKTWNGQPIAYLEIRDVRVQDDAVPGPLS